MTIDRQGERALSYALVPEAPMDEVVVVPVDTFEDRPHWANWVLGGGLALLGVGLAISPIWTLATEGQVTDRGAAGTDTVVFGPVSGTLMALGAASFIAGVVVLILHPITEHVRVGVGVARLSVEGTF